MGYTIGYTDEVSYECGYKDGEKAAYNWIIEIMSRYLRASEFEYEEVTAQDLLEYVKQKIEDMNK